MKLYAYRWQKAHQIVFASEVPDPVRGIVQADDPYDAFQTLSGGWEFRSGLEEDEGWIILAIKEVGVLELFPYDIMVTKARDEPTITNRIS